MIYSYNQLRGVLKVGDKVREVEDKASGCQELDDSNEQEITRVQNAYFCINGCAHDYEGDYYLEIIETNQPTMNNEREEITWENLKAGDYVKYVKDENKYTVKIHARINDIVFVSKISRWWKEWETEMSDVVHIEQLKRASYTIVQPKTPRKVTLAEIAEKFGEEVEVVE